MPPDHHSYEEHDDVQGAQPRPEGSDLEDKAEQEEEDASGSKREHVTEVQTGHVTESNTEIQFDKRKELRLAQDPNLVSVLKKKKKKKKKGAGHHFIKVL